MDERKVSPVLPGDPAWVTEAMRRFDAANAADPNRETAEGVEHPKEVLYARRLTDWVLRLAPDASLPLRLAARCQHVCRWMIPRSDYPAGRAGYLKWRAELKLFHARRAGEILTEVGCPEEVRRRVAALNLKQNLASDPDCAVLEDALCLVFLEFQFNDLAARADDETMINAVKKSWAKMSPAGREQALRLNHSPRARALLERALESLPGEGTGRKADSS